MNHNSKATGKVIYALGNLIKVAFEGEILQGEVAFVQIENESLKAEVIEVEGRNAKLQVFEDIRGIKYGTPVVFMKELLEVELGPGLLAEIFDGLQNPLQKVADVSGLYLTRGIYIESLDRVKRWHFKPHAKVGARVRRGDALGQVPESHFIHKILVPFKMFRDYTVTWVIEEGSYTVDTVVAKISDEEGRIYDISMVQKWPVKFPLIEGQKVQAKKMMTTGIRIIDTMVPMVKGGSACTPGPFGAGKTVTQQLISKYSNVDVVVIAACGERAGEVVETLKTFPTLTDVHSNQPLMNRTTIICNTSSMPVAAREASVYVGVTIAEYYRQMGLDVLLLADSTSRWAQAMREISGRLEEIPGDEAFPAYLASRIAAFYERSGVVKLKSGKEGSVTIIGAVSPAGGNFNEPVTQATLVVVGCFICLSREFSDKRRYPAIDPLLSWSKYIDIVSEEMKVDAPLWGEWVKSARSILNEGDRIARRMEVVGQEGTSLEDIMTYLKAELFSFVYLQQNAFDVEDAYCSIEQQKKQFQLVMKIFETRFSFKYPDQAKSAFLKLQSEVKGLNYLKFESQAYEQAFKRVVEEIENLETDREIITTALPVSMMDKKSRGAVL
jgi:V/A-type H+-transporting ATPase subunit A